jgi:hypothetical protein
MSHMVFWVTELPGGGYAMGEASDELEARLMIKSQQRGSVTWSARGQRWRWTVVLDDGKTSHGWADTPDDAWAQVREALHRPYRGTHYRGPRGLWVREP